MEKIREVEVVRKEIKTPSVGGSMLEGNKIGYIRIAVFNENTADFQKEMQKSQKQGNAGADFRFTW